ncbi:hypothetical protein N7468_002325 [Penicillium chermesinum]|uniref:Uncharacterized protein n=1 Tax=Penicillium chermesinum TaxID=63820 RepID=A0A9W9TXV8_9EURO|nr:uncharacterized protein N7468_002325 [Penicillium chermesinum]KAJ5247342.1 hypothetical protein N7468_002325 [Penicillium chermesinum]
MFVPMIIGELMLANQEIQRSGSLSTVDAYWPAKPHLYITSSLPKGNGNRDANFIKLWSIEALGSTDPSVIGMLSNFLEMGLCRVFQSLPPADLEAVFGPPSPTHGEKYTFIGLNLVSPLLQGRYLSPWTRHKHAIRLKEANDPDIRAYPDHRLKHDHNIKRYQKLQPSTWTRLTHENCKAAVESAATTDLILSQKLKRFVESLSVATKSAKDQDSFEWLHTELNALSLLDGSFSVCMPIGSSKAQLGVILSETFIQSAVPSTLQDCGFNEANILIWAASFQRSHIGPGLKLATNKLQNFSSRFRELNFAVASHSQVRIVLVADKLAEAVLFSDNSRFKRFSLDLQNQLFEGWINIEEETPSCIYLSPEPLLVALSSHDRRKVKRLTTLLRFSTFLLNLKNINPSACSSALAAIEIIRRYDMERDGHEKMTAESVDPYLEGWLHEKGFTSSDIRMLEKCADSLHATRTSAGRITPSIRNLSPSGFDQSRSPSYSSRSQPG